MTLFPLHGFLGTTMDWEMILPSQQHLTYICRSLYDPSFTPPEKGLIAWGDSFNVFAKKAAPPPRYLLGYSLGGRLGLHALIQAPHIWQAAIFVSTHPGLSPEERPTRALQDLEWAKAFETTPFPELLAAWNQQPLFGGSPFPSPRLLQDQDRPRLASSLCHWSLSEQENVQEALAEVSLPILWIVGSKDTRYCETATQLSFCHPLSRVTVIEKVGHRAPWENPKRFKEIVWNFLRIG